MTGTLRGPLTRWARVAVVIGALTTGAALPGAHITAGAAPADCQTVASPLIDIKPVFDGEPRLRIPLPAGWRIDTRLNSETIRFAALAPHLAAKEFVPNVVVTAVKVPARLVTPQQEFEAERKFLVDKLGATVLAESAGTVCGQPMRRLDYLATIGKIGPNTGTALSAYTQISETLYGAAVTVQTRDPDNPAYQRDAQEILTGFQVLPLPPV